MEEEWECIDCGHRKYAKLVVGKIKNLNHKSFFISKRMRIILKKKIITH